YLFCGPAPRGYDAELLFFHHEHLRLVELGPKEGGPESGRQDHPHQSQGEMDRLWAVPADHWGNLRSVPDLWDGNRGKQLCGHPDLRYFLYRDVVYGQ